jgi:hypothetical protein
MAHLGAETARGCGFGFLFFFFFGLGLLILRVARNNGWVTGNNVEYYCPRANLVANTLANPRCL